MLARIRKSMEQKDQGFTLIELLVVMIIIGILAAIAIPVFLNQRKKARETSAKADATVIGKELAAYYVDGTSAAYVTSSGTAWTLYTVATDGAITGGTATTTTGTVSSGNKATAVGYAAGKWCSSVATSDGTIWTYDWKSGLSSSAGTAGAAPAACTPSS